MNSASFCPISRGKKEGAAGRWQVIQGTDNTLNEMCFRLNIQDPNTQQLGSGVSLFLRGTDTLNDSAKVPVDMQGARRRFTANTVPASARGMNTSTSTCTPSDDSARMGHAIKVHNNLDAKRKHVEAPLQSQEGEGNETVSDSEKQNRWASPK